MKYRVYKRQYFSKDYWTVPGDPHYEHECLFTAKQAVHAFAMQGSVVDIQIRPIDREPLLPGEALCPECGNVFRGAGTSCSRCHQRRVVAFILLAELLDDRPAEVSK